MTFAIGLICGFAIGACVTALAYAWMDGFADPEAGPPWLGRTCPPCDGHCHQGRDCPAGEKK